MHIFVISFQCEPCYLVALPFNRYVEEHVQKTGVAIETQGFTFITSGRKRESLTVRQVNIQTQLSTSTSSLITSDNNYALSLSELNA